MEPLKFLKEKRFRDVLLIGAIGLLLLIAAYFVFTENRAAETDTVGNTYEMTLTESRLCSVLSRIEGVGKLEVYVSEDETGNPQSAIIVFEGADSLSVRMDVMRAAAGALGISQNDVLIYKMTT